jgi:hypothetical protein
MKTTIAILALFLSFRAYADCDQPPFDDTQAHYDSAVSMLSAATPDAVKDKGQMLYALVQSHVRRMMQLACRAKLDPAARADLYRVGLTDDVILRSGTVDLVMSYQTLLNHLPMDAKAAGTPALDEYRSMGVKAFVVDGPELAAKRAKVSISGMYIRNGQVPTMYADTNSVIMARYHSDVGTQASVPLMIDKASHDVRQRIFSCDENPGSGQVGCPLAIRGRATMCTLGNAFGASQNVPCLEVAD